MPTSKTSRASIVAKFAAGATLTKWTTEFEALLMPAREKELLRSLAREEVADMLFDGLAQLRGSALKLAQLFCADTGLLPPEYTRKLEDAQYHIPQLSSPMIRSVLRRELGDDPFADFAFETVGAASLGQVHKATLKGGETVAVKIQYPGVQESLKSDLKMARMVLNPALKTNLILSTLAQLEKRLEEEVDYRIEAQNMNWYRDQGLPVEVPRAHTAHTTSRVLVMSWMEGLTIDEWIETQPSQDRRDQLAQTIYNVFVKSVFALRKFHSDPNLGNFLIGENDELILLDFGSLTEISEKDLGFYQLLWEGQDFDSLAQEYHMRGARLHPQFIDQVIRPYTNWIAKFRVPDSFDFGSNPGFVKEGFDLFSSQLFNSDLRDYAAQLTLVHRTLLGLFSVFTKLKARVAAQP